MIHLLPSIVPLIGTETLIAIGISLAISAISYGIQALFAEGLPTIRGPRLDDLGGPQTTPGRPIPFGVGRNIVPGQIIWTTGLQEHRHKTKVKGGKGGGKSQKVITYTYTTSLAVAINDGEVACFERVIGNASKIIWSRGQGDPPTDGEIEVQTDALFDEVYAEKFAFFSAQLTTDDPPVARFTSGEADNMATQAANSEASKLRDSLEARQEDAKPRYNSIEFFFGTEDQEPSPTIESIEGAGNVPAFKGIAYLVINDLELEDFGRFTPGISVDYVAGPADASSGTVVHTLGPDTAPAHAHIRWQLFDYARGKIYTPVTSSFYQPAESYMEFDLGTLAYIRTLDTTINTEGEMELRGIDETTGYLYGWHGIGGGNMNLYVYDPVTDSLITDIIVPEDDDSPSDFNIQHYNVIRSSNGDHAVALSTDQFSGVNERNNVLNFPALTLHSVLDTPEPTVLEGGNPKWQTGSFNAVRGGDTAWAVWMSDFAIRIYKWTIDNDGDINTTTYTEIPSTLFHATKEFTKEILTVCPLIDESDDTLVFYFKMNVPSSPSSEAFWVKWSPALDAIVWATSASLFLNQTEVSRTNVRLNGGIFRIPDDAALKLMRIDLSSGTITEDPDLTEDEVFAITGFDSYTTWDGVSGCLYGLDFGVSFEIFITYCWPNVCESTTTISDVITAYMTRAGYASSEFSIEASLAGESIWGFNDNSGRTVRELLENLARIRPVIANESEGVIKFRLHDQSIVETIPVEDVRAYDGDRKPPEWLNEVVTKEDLALPKELRINYQDVDRALNPASSIFSREVTQSVTTTEFNVQAVDDAVAMRDAVFSAMSVLMTSKRTFKLSLPLKYIPLEPGDAIIVPVSDTALLEVQIQRVELGANLLIEMECSLRILTDLDIIHTTQFERINTKDSGPEAIRTRVHLLDLPYLTDLAELNELDLEDDGVYIAFSTSASGWPGANLYVDETKLQTTVIFGVPTQGSGAADWLLVASSSVLASAGIIGKLPLATASALVLDTGSELIISFDDPLAEFTSISDVAILASQDNALLVGDEIIQAQNAELLDDDTKTYAFTNLYRGLQGTEWAIGSQALGDTVVHLEPSAIQRVDLTNPDLKDLSVDFRAVTVGSDLLTQTTTTLLYTRASRKPYAPAIVDIVRDGSGNLTFTLIPRNRYGADWNAGSPPFASDPDTWEVDILDLSASPDAVVRTIVLTDVLVSYTAAQQLTDFGSPIPATVVVRPYQINAEGDRGFTNQETI